jgi:hypothetical protein
MPGFHGGHDALQGLRIVGVAREHLIAEREAIEGHDQRDAHLLAIGAVVAGIAALCQRVRFGLAFEERARHIVEQDFVLHREQLAAAPGQMRFQRRLVHEQMIQSAIETVLVDLILAQLKQIGERRAPVPVLGNVQFARGFAKPCRYQNGGYLLPRHAFLARRKKLLAQVRKTGPAP